MIKSNSIFRGSGPPSARRACQEVRRVLCQCGPGQRGGQMLRGHSRVGGGSFEGGHFGKVPEGRDGGGPGGNTPKTANFSKTPKLRPIQTANSATVRRAEAVL